MSNYGYSENDLPDILENIVDKMNDVELSDADKTESHAQRDSRLFADVKFRIGYIKTKSGWDSI